MPLKPLPSTSILQGSEIRIVVVGLTTATAVCVTFDGNVATYLQLDKRLSLTRCTRQETAEKEFVAHTEVKVLIGVLAPANGFVLL